MASSSDSRAGVVEGQMIKIKVKTMEPANYDIDVSPEMTVGALKSEHLAQRVNAPPDRQRVIFRGRALRDEQNLSSAGVGNDDTIHLVIRPADLPTPDTAAQAAPQASNAQSADGLAALLGLPGGVGNLIQGLLGAGGAQTGTIQINGMSPIPLNMVMSGRAQAGGQAAPAPAPQAPTAGPALTGPNAPAGQPHPNAAHGAAPGPHGGAFPAGAFPTPAWLNAPHLVSALSGYLEAIQSPGFVPQPMPLAWSHVIQPGEQARAMAGLTDGLREALRGVYLPAELRALLVASETDREGRVADAGAAGRPSTSVLSEAGPGGQPRMPNQVLLDPDYRYLPLAVAAMAEMTRRADVYLSTSLTPRMRELSGAILALAMGDPRSNRALEQHVLSLGQHLASSAALLTELARMATGLGSALHGDMAPLIFSRPVVLQPNGSGSALMVLQPRVNPMAPPMNTNRFAMPGGSFAVPFHPPWTSAGGARPMGMPMLLQQAMQLSGQNMGQVLGQATAGQAQDDPAAAAAAAAAGMPPGSIRIDIVDNGDARMGPLLSMLGGGGGAAAGGAGGEGMMALAPDMSNFGQWIQEGAARALQLGVEGANRAAAAVALQQQQQQPQGPRAAAPTLPGGAPAPPAAGAPAADEPPRVREYMAMLGPLIREMAVTVASNVGQRLTPLVPLLQSPAQTAQLVSALVSEVLNETMSRTVQTMLSNEDQISAMIRSMEDSGQEGEGSGSDLADMMRQVAAFTETMVSGGRAPAARQPGPTPATQTSAQVPTQAPEADAASSSTADAPSLASTVAAEVPPRAAAAALFDEAHPPNVATMSATASVGFAEQSVLSQPAPPVQPPPAVASLLPADAAPAGAPGRAQDLPPASGSSSQSSAPRPRGLGLGLKPVVKKKPPVPVPSSEPAQHGTSISGAGASGVRSALPGAATGMPHATPGTAGPDMSGLMAMMGQMMGPAGRPNAAGGPLAGGGATPGPAAGGQQAMALGSASGAGAGVAPDMSGLMAMMGQMMSGGGGGGGGGGPARAGGGGGGAGGMGGLMQMANSLASDPAMQPMLQSAMSSLMGGGGGAAGGGSGGLGGLLGSLMGGMPAAGGGASSGRDGARVEEVMGFDVLDELEPEEAETWRATIEADEAQQSQMAQETEAPSFSEIYLAGLPRRSASLMDAMGGAREGAAQ